VTWPWSFGIPVEAGYRAATVAARRAVSGRDASWDFLRTRHDRPATRRAIMPAREGQA
jgi:hypothetical protein